MTLSVLVVDDDESMRRLLSVALPLAAPGVQVVATARDVDDGLDAAGRSQPDLIILDHFMPRRTGAESVGEFFRKCPDAEIVLFSAYLDAPGSHGVVRRAAEEYDIEVVPKGSLEIIERVVQSAALRRSVP